VASRLPVPGVPYGRQVFVNCPYDDAYLPLLRALVFTVHACGFRPRLAVEDGGTGSPRLERILELISQCKLGIHDLSRVQVDSVRGLPRFNMPFECGLFVGAQSFGSPPQRTKALLLLEARAYRHQRTMSDAAGVDPKVHANSQTRLIACVRTFLAAHIAPRPLGAAHLRNLYAEFRRAYPTLARNLGHAPDDLLRLDAFADWRWIAADWLAARAAR
jgi:hypothetical protein